VHTRLLLYCIYKSGHLSEKNPGFIKRAVIVMKIAESIESQEVFNDFDSREIEAQIDVTDLAAELNNVSHYFIYET